MILIRKIQIGDAENLLNLLKKLDTETTFLLYEKGERKRTIEQQRKDIQEQLSKGVLTFVLEDNKKLVGYVFGNIYTANRKKHCMNLAIAILQEYTGKGYGTKLMNTIEKYAINNGITRLELEVSKKNKIAISLYHKRGFEMEGVKRNAFLVNGKYEDELLMAKIIK
ncbi:MAG: GNAT family N-acetyltransferase [Flavobacteriales bacterium]|nr:GNAT family N-acetyltransferase [Flavobacteriales bacterium]